MSPSKFALLQFLFLGNLPGYLAGCANNANILLIFCFTAKAYCLQIVTGRSLNLFPLVNKLRSLLARTELTFVNHNMKIMSLENKTIGLSIDCQ